MDPQYAIDISRDALQVVLMLSAPVLIVGLVIGVLVGVVQAITQVQDQTVMFVIKLVATVFVVILTLPWMIEQLNDYSRQVIQDIPNQLSGRYQ